MNFTRKYGLLLALLMLISGAAAADGESTFATTTGKKLIEYGWDVPSPEYVRDHIREMEKRPFEGVIMRLPKRGGNVFDVSADPDLQDQIKVLSDIKWNKFTDNFLAMYAASTMDWYSESDWKKVLSKVQFNARAAKAANCVGLLFDPEPYGFNPWNYRKQKHADKYSYAEYSARVYLRGQQFMQTMQRQIPDVKVLMFHQYQMMYAVTHDFDPAKRQATLANAAYGLYLPFLNGMLSVINRDAQMIDGNENSYYYEKPEQFYHAYWQMRNGAKIHVPQSLRRKYETNEKTANALYVDHLFGYRNRFYVAKGMTPQEHAKWFEQNVYYGLQTTDEYVWLYSEKMDWWKDTNLPPGLENAIISAKRKLANGQSLGFSLDEVFAKAEQTLSRSLESKLERRSASVPHLTATQTPKIDGNLDEKIYTQLPWTDAFVGFLKPGEAQKLTAATRTFVAYDSKNLYIAFRCEEPNMKGQQIVSAARDGGIWGGESVEVSILQSGQPTSDANAKFYHFILNPTNDKWDALNTGTSNDKSYNPHWQSATAKSASRWTAEIAIPWQEIGMPGATSGTQIRANLARQRVSDNTELSSWSQFLTGFQEPQNLGTLTLQ